MKYTKHPVSEMISVICDSLDIDYGDASRLYEIADTITMIDNLCDHYCVLDDEEYGNVAVVYNEDSVPTNREFWRECGIGDEDIDNPDDHVPTYPLQRYLDSIDYPIYDEFDSWVPARIHELITHLRSLQNSEDSANA